jgi:hypothetical protein
LDDYHREAEERDGLHSIKRWGFDFAAEKRKSELKNLETPGQNLINDDFEWPRFKQIQSDCSERER